MAASGDTTYLVVKRLENGAACHKSVPKKPPPPPPPKPAAKLRPLQMANRGRGVEPEPSRPSPVARGNTSQDNGSPSSNSHHHSECDATVGAHANHPSPPTNARHNTPSNHPSLTQNTDSPNEVANSKIKGAGVSKPDPSTASETPSGDPPSGAVCMPAGGLSGGAKLSDLPGGLDCDKTADERVGGVRIEMSVEQNRRVRSKSGTNLHEQASARTRTHTRTQSYTHALKHSQSDVHVGGRGADYIRGSSEASSRSGVGSSSSSLSHVSSNSFVSRTLLLEHLKSELYQRTASDPTLLASGHQDEAEQDSDEIVQQLLEHIVSLKMELTSVREENEKLKQVRTTMDDELHTLTENLFEEAYKMVDDAKGGKVVAEKRLADAAGKIDAMETEMSALKNLLQPPSDKHSLNPHHHHKHKRPSVKKVIKKISKKAGVGRNSPTTKHRRHTVTQLEHRSDNKGAMLVEGEPVKDDYDAFSRWVTELKAGGTHDHAYLWSVVATDVRPCLAFRNKELSEQVLHAVEQNHLLMESLPALAEENRECALSGPGNGLCTHRLQLGDSEQWHHISQQARNRIVAACDFYMYISHIEKGILKLDTSKLYWQVSRLRAVMSLARLNLSLPEDKPLQ